MSQNSLRKRRTGQGTTKLPTHRGRTVFGIRPVRIEELEDVIEFLAEYADSNVDIIRQKLLQRVLRENDSVLFTMTTAEGERVAVFGWYFHSGDDVPNPENERPLYCELCTICVHPDYRGLHLADFAVILRTVLALIMQNDVVPTAVLYVESFRQARVLRRWGWQALSHYPLHLHRHVVSSNPFRPAQVFALNPWRLPEYARMLIRILEWKPVDWLDSRLVFAFDPDMSLLDESMLKALRCLAAGDLSIIGLDGPAPESLEDYIAGRTDSPIMTPDDFDGYSHRPH